MVLGVNPTSQSENEIRITVLIMKPAIILTSHNKEARMAVEVGMCVICDEPVYFSGRGISGEISAEELKKIPNPKFIAAQCIKDMVLMIDQMMSLPYGMREEIKDIAIKEATE